MKPNIPALAALATLIALTGCHQPKARDAASAAVRRPPPITQYGDALAKKANSLFADTLQSRAARAGDRAADSARNAMASRGYEDVVGSDDCPGNCSNHDAGFAFARARKIENPDNCPGGQGQSFADGCRAYGQQIESAQDGAQSAVMNGKGTAN